MENEQNKSSGLFENRDTLKISQKGEKSLMYLKNASSLFHICFLNYMASLYIYIYIFFFILFFFPLGDNVMKTIRKMRSAYFKVSQF